MFSADEIEAVRQTEIAPRFIQHHTMLLAFGGAAFVGGYIIDHRNRRTGRRTGRPATPGGLRSTLRAALQRHALTVAGLVGRMLARGFLATGPTPVSQRVVHELFRMRCEGEIERYGVRGAYRYALK